jgi:hypothetical protein
VVKPPLQIEGSTMCSKGDETIETRNDKSITSSKGISYYKNLAGLLAQFALHMLNRKFRGRGCIFLIVAVVLVEIQGGGKARSLWWVSALGGCGRLAKLMNVTLAPPDNA